MAETAFHHGDLPDRVAVHLRCPNAYGRRHAKTEVVAVEAVPGVGYRAKFRCMAPPCQLEFTISDAQLRRIAPGAE